MSCCVGMCCRESSWLGVRRMLRNESPSLRRIRRTPRARTSSHSLKPRASKGIHNFIHKDNHFHQFQPFPEPSYLIFWTWWSSIIAEFHHITLELFHSVPCVCVCVWCVCLQPVVYTDDLQSFQVLQTSGRCRYHVLYHLKILQVS